MILGDEADHAIGMSHFIARLLRDEDALGPEQFFQPVPE